MRSRAWRLALFGLVAVFARATVDAQSAPAGRVGGQEAKIGDQLRHFRVYPHLDKAYRLINQHKLAEAKPELEACLELEGRNPEIWSTYLDVLYQLKEYDHVVERFDGLGALREDARLRRYHLLSQLERHNTDAVVEDLRTLGSGNEVITKSELQRIAVRFIDLSRAQKRPESLISFLAVVPDSALPPPVAYEAANALRSLGKLNEASAVYQRVAQADAGGKLRVDAYKTLASLAIERQQRAQAREFLARAQTLQPNDLSVIRSLGELAAGREDWVESARYYRQWLDLSRTASREDRYHAAMSLGRAYVQLNQAEHASDAFALALRAKPNDANASVAAAQALQQRGRMVEALGHFRTALSVAPTGDLNAHVGLLVAQLERPREALPYLERASELGVSPDLAPALFGQLGYVYAALNQPAAAREAFTRALAQSPNQAALHAAIGRVSLTLNDLPSAIDHFETSLSLQSDPQIAHDLALAYARVGKGGDAARLVEHLRSVPNADSLLDTDLWNQLAESAFRNGRFREAASLFRQASARANGQGWPALDRAAESFERAGALTDAAAIWDELAASNRAPRDARAEAAERAGYAYLRVADVDHGVSSLLTATRLGHDSWNLHLDRALALIKLGRWSEALDESRASLARRNSARGHLAAAMCFKALGKPGMAVYQFAQSLDRIGEIEPADQKYVFNELTSMYANEANYEEASKAAARSLSISPDPAIALQLGRLQRLLGKNEESRLTLDAIDVSSLEKPLRLAVLDEQSQVRGLLGDRQQAANALQEALALEPSESRLYQLGIHFRELGDLDRAVTNLRASLERAPGNIRYRETLGYVCLQMGRLREGVDLLSSVAQQEPQNVQVQQDVADALMRLGDQPAAVRWLRQAIERAGPANGEADDNEQRRQALLRMRSTVAQIGKSYDVAAYFGYQAIAAPNSIVDQNAKPLFLSQGGFEFARFLMRPQRGLSLIARLMSVGDGQFSNAGGGQFTNTGNGLLTNTGSGQFTNAGMIGALNQLAVGLRYRPFASQNLNFSAERLFQLGGDLPNSWLLRTLYSIESGGDVRPEQGWRPYSLIYGDVAGFLGPYRSVITYGEARLGASRSLDNTWVVRPHIVAIARSDFVGTGGDAFQLGAGMGITHYFRSGGYEGPAPSFEVRLYGSAAGTRSATADQFSGVRGLTLFTTFRF
jgi:adsorption protein A